MKYKFKITVFTPTFNRGYILGQLYSSLQKQSFKDFEWLIIDDGSSDNTEELVATWLSMETRFRIRYVKQENGGKCRAINRALELAEGELFFTVDSDDYLTNDALEKIAMWESNLPKTGCYCGIAGNLGVSEEYSLNRYFPSEYYEGTLLDRYTNVDGERAIVIYTDIHRKYLYPCYDNETFMTEAVVWNRIAHDGYKMRFYNDIIWIYEYKEDGLTKAGSKLFIDNPHGYGLWLREKAKFENVTLVGKLKMYYTFTCDLAMQYNNKMIAESIGTSKYLVGLFKIIHNLKYKMRKSE